MSRALNASGILPFTDQTALARFGRGFCRAQPLFSFTDVGYGKEQADNKVRKLFEIMEKNIQCRSLILGGCHDNGYAPFLESFRGNQKICLLETTPPAADFRKLSFKRVSFPSVFRSEPVPSKTTAPPALPPASAFYQGTSGSPPPTINPALGMAGLPSPAPTVSPKQAPSKPELPANSYAAMSRSSAPLTINIASQKKIAPPRPFYQLNKNDQRVDVPLAKADPNAVKSLDDRRHKTGANMCNRYHLSGVCKNGDNCSFTHGSRLPTAEILALRHKTRNLVCSSGHHCVDPGCLLGHHCVNPGSCYFGMDCRFSDMHGMDIVSLSRLGFRENDKLLTRTPDSNY